MSAFVWQTEFCLSIVDLSTAMKFRLHTIADIWRKVGVFWGGLMYPKRPAKPLTGWLQTVRHQSFSLKYHTILYLKGLQNCSFFCKTFKKKFAEFRRKSIFHRVTYWNRRSSGGQGSIPGRSGLRRPAVFQPLEIQGHIVPHWKALMSDCLEPAGQGLDRMFRVH